MTEQQASLEQRVACLELQVAELTKALAPLSEARAAAPPVAAAVVARPPGHPRPAGDTASEEILSWVDRAYLLPRIATTSFILVVALALRTLTDSEVIPAQLGTLLGMVYAFVLIAYGWFSYSQRGAQAPVFALWGTIVMCSLIVETQRVFQSLPTVVAYILLAGLGLATLLMSRSSRAALPVFAGTLGMSFGAFAINYPNPVFPLLTGVLLLANIFAAFATGLLRASWLRWLLLILALVMVRLWDFKLDFHLAKLKGGVLAASLQGFVPAVIVLGMVFLAIALAGILGKIQEKVSKFDLVLPVINALWLCDAGSQAAKHGLVPPWLVGVLGVLAGAAHLGVGWWLAQRDDTDDRSTMAFALAGGLFVALALPAAIGSPLVASTAVAALAIGLAWASRRIDSGGVRLVAVLLQFYASAALIILIKTTETTAPSLLGAIASGLLALFIAYHYFWVRSTPPPRGETWVDRLNEGEFWAPLLLSAALLSGFFTLRMGLYQGLTVLNLATPSAFSSSQSVLINLSATVLLLLSLRKRDRDLRNVGVLITAVAAGKILFDVIGLKGMALLLSIFSFGVAAAVTSVVLGRWGKTNATATAEGAES